MTSDVNGAKSVGTPFTQWGFSGFMGAGGEEDFT